MSGEDHYHQPRQGHLSKDQSIYYKNEDGDYLEVKDTVDDKDDIFHHDDRYCWLDDSKKKYKYSNGRRFNVQYCTRNKMPPRCIESVENSYEEMLNELLNNWSSEEFEVSMEAIGLNLLHCNSWNNLCKEFEVKGNDNPKELVKKLEDLLIKNWKPCPMTLGIHENCVASDGSTGFGLTGCNFHNHSMER